MLLSKRYIKLFNTYFSKTYTYSSFKKMFFLCAKPVFKLDYRVDY